MSDLLTRFFERKNSTDRLYNEAQTRAKEAWEEAFRSKPDLALMAAAFVDTQQSHIIE
jgi:hypothetical protein